MSTTHHNVLQIINTAVTGHPNVAELQELEATISPHRIAAKKLVESSLIIFSHALTDFVDIC